MRIRVAQIQHHSHVLHSDIGIRLNWQTFKSDCFVVAEDNSQAGDARHSQSVGAGSIISGVVVQRIEAQAQVNCKCFYRIAVLKIPIFLTLNQPKSSGETVSVMSKQR